MNAIDIRGLCKKYPTFALQDVSFSVPQGAVMGFIGRNGAGKSTTLKSMLGLVHPDAGEVEILGRSFVAEEKSIKENIGVVLGGIDFYPKKKIAVLTDVTRRFYTNWDQEKYRHYLHLFGIEAKHHAAHLVARRHAIGLDTARLGLGRRAHHTVMCQIHTARRCRRIGLGLAQPSINRRHRFAILEHHFSLTVVE